MAGRSRRALPLPIPDEGLVRNVEEAPASQGVPIPPPPPVVDYGMFMQGLVQAMQTQA